MRKVCLLLLSFGTGSLLACLFVLSMAAANTQGPVCAETSAEVSKPPVMPVYALAPAEITLPAEIAGTTLRAEQLLFYEGSYMEDGSHQEVMDIAGLAVCNYGSEMVDQAEVVLRRGAMALHFRFTCIPPGETVMALEQDRKRCPYRNFTSCSGRQSGPENLWLTEGEVETSLLENNGIRLVNCTDRMLTGVKLCYRTYPAGEQIGVGGSAYWQMVGDLAPGESKEIFPHHYAASVSRIVGLAES